VNVGDNDLVVLQLLHIQVEAKDRYTARLPRTKVDSMQTTLSIAITGFAILAGAHRQRARCVPKQSRDWTDPSTKPITATT